MFKNLLDNIQTKYNQKKEKNAYFQHLLETTSTLQNLFPNPIPLKENNTFKVPYITNECPDLNNDKAKIIASIIPINETFLTIIYAKEILTNIEYFFISTNHYLWIINEKNYGAYPYQNLNCQIIKNNILSKIILLNNIIFEINGTDNKLQTFISLLNNQQTRNNLIEEKTKYLCGIIPIYQNLNQIGSGISIDKEGNIVFHSKETNYKLHYTKLQDIEILLDNQSIYSSNNQNNKINSFQTSCYQISIRIKTKDNKILIIPILEPNTFGTKYQRQDTIFQTNFSFTKEIIFKIEQLKKD